MSSKTKNDAVYRLNKTEPVKALRTSRKFQITQYSKLVVPVSMRSIYWQYFGFPANSEGDIISKNRIVCVLCRGQIAYNRNTSNLRMHLQNKHSDELRAIESVATSKTCKTKLIRRDASNDDVPYVDESLHEFYSLGGSNEIVRMEEVEPEPDATLFFEDASPLPNKKRNMRNLDIDSHLMKTISTFMISDLERPEVVLGKGFHRLLTNIENPASVPSVSIVVKEILPTKYQQVKSKLMKELKHVGSVGLTIEEWLCVEQRHYVSVCVYYQYDNAIQCKMLGTFSFLPEMDTRLWQIMLNGLLEDWELASDRISAAVCSMERESMVEALESLCIPVVPCLDYSIRESVKQCFSDEVINNIINKVRRQMTLLKTCPLVSSKAEKICQSESLPSITLDVEALWLTTVDMLEVAHKWRNESKKIFAESCMVSSIEPLIEMSDGEWDIVSDLVETLQPLKITVVSMSEEKVPFLSLVRPMLWQIIEQKFSLEEDESETKANLKKAIIGILNYRYSSEKVANVLSTATVVDPRFKLLPDYDDEEKAKIARLVHDAIKDVIVETEEDEKATTQNRRQSNISLLLGELKRKKVKEDVEEAATWEYQTYLTQQTAVLDLDPVEWWFKNTEKYPRVGNLAEKYLCVPAVATLPGKRTADFDFHVKRSTLSADVVNHLLFLHVNLTTPEKNY